MGIREWGERMGKWEKVLQSRKVWASVVAVGLLTVLFYSGAISGETYAWGVTIAVSVFTGAVAIEDGLSALFVGLATELVEEDKGQEALHQIDETGEDAQGK